MTPKPLVTLLTLAGLCLQTPAFGHGHINAGAVDSNTSGSIDPGDKLFLYFEAGTNTTTLTGNSGANVYGADGYLWNGFTTMTALHQSSVPALAPNYDPLGAPSGSFLSIQLVSLSGPADAKLAFYEAGALDPTWVYQIGTGLLSGSGAFALTEQTWFAGSPGDGIPSDPYGHIHGRMFAVDTPGSFSATWTLADANSTTTGLLPSDIATSTFVAVPEPGTIALLTITVLFGLAALLRRDVSPAREDQP